MPRPPVHTRLSHRRLKELISYNRKTGELKWRVDRSHTARAGDDAGTIRTDGFITVVIDGKRWLGHRLAWFYETGAEPDCRLCLVDHDGTNLKWTNIERETDRYQTSTAAIRQRERRRQIRREIAEGRRDHPSVVAYRQREQNRG